MPTPANPPGSGGYIHEETAKDWERWVKLAERNRAMKKKKDESRKAQELRRKAEELLNSWMLDAEKLAPVEMVNLLYELQVHQIELEMQN